jgi:radical SAM superfamily enzyme YgiQ (UPF0313 family)
MATVLLSSVTSPFGPSHGDGFGVSYEGSHQLMWAQGIFRPRGTTTQWGIEFIAANLKAPTTTLHYPTLRQFIAEVKKGYDYVGIAFVSTTLHKVRPMIEAIRRHAPKTQIVLGGYGTALGDEITGLADHVCRGEGVDFMRRLLDEPLETPFVQPDITQTGRLFSLPILSKLGYVFAGLGCPNGCDFCATSHYFGRRHIRLLPDGAAILAAIEGLRARHPGLDSIWINDEDFLLDQQRGREFLAAIRKSNLPPLSISIFSSVKALSQFEPSELVEMGIDWVWIGYEGRRAAYAKMDGRAYSDLLPDLHRHGISVLASMIIGFDYQTPEIIRQEYEELMALRPSISQFMIYGPSHGTPLYARMKAEGRLTSAMADNRNHDGFSLVFRHPHLEREEMETMQRTLYHEEFRRLGPSVFRVVEDLIEGHVTLRNHPAARVRAKAARYGRDSHRALAVLPASHRYLTDPARAWIASLEARIAAETGPMTRGERFLSRVMPLMLRLTDWKLRHGVGGQPEFTRHRYHGGRLLPDAESLPDLAPVVR